MMEFCESCVLPDAFQILVHTSSVPKARDTIISMEYGKGRQTEEI